MSSDGPSIRNSQSLVDQVIANAPRLPRITSAVAIYRHLHAAILSNALPPGTALQDKLLCAEFAVSRTPVREALIRLAEDGLVDIFPQSGTFVSRIKADAIPEALDIRQALESLAVSRAAALAKPTDIARLDQLLARQTALAEAGDTGLFHEADEFFHETIGMIADRPGLWRLVKQVKLQIDRTRVLTLPAPGRMIQVVSEHRLVRDAIAAGDAVSAQVAMTDHLNVVIPDLARLRGEYPAYFT
ncbi:GntR family transcriptional regulator [Acidisoma cellulosilytica]|uniref:GntR family transcriptional regulator n=1 Tax=Acidisoma cellulosilyticum TaxID=2802395 RepID=A0A963YY47_9PROT|nr:GntR family transcriptional regulator [Acidisoma cellulosilyticum]MCB8879336.1 GntR family transcriptional regulator [Acidisoma cellulosilyticum]